MKHEVVLENPTLFDVYFGTTPARIRDEAERVTAAGMLLALLNRAKDLESHLHQWNEGGKFDGVIEEVRQIILDLKLRMASKSYPY